jgi:hypothetical protein
MTLTPSEVASLKSALGWWEWAEYVSTGIVFVGCIGEFIAEFTRISQRENIRHTVARLSLALVIAGIAGELCATVKTSQLSGQIIAYVEQNAADAKTSADSAADASKRASDAAGEAESLAHSARQEADSFAKDIVSAKNQAALAESHLAEARRSAAEADAKAVAAARDLANYEAPRTLTDQQAQNIAATLKPFGQQEFEVIPYWDSKESMGIAQRIADILVGLAGWKLEQPTGFTALMGGLIGVKVDIHPLADANSNGAAKALVTVLNQNGIEAKLEIENPTNNPKNNKINLSVGAKQ